jgi:hypothetical protein
MSEQSIDCPICASPLLERLNIKRNWQTPRLLRWAEIRDLEIDETILSTHLQSHINGNGSEPTKTRVVKNRIKPEAVEEIPPKMQLTISTDEQLLNLIISRIYDNLKENQIELKVEHAFKAIEIKQKLAESGNVENLLLELLTEIRNQELPK